MAFKNIFKLFLIIFFVTGTLNFTYANGGPGIGPNEAKTLAQNYLDLHDLPYTAIAPDNYDDWYIKINDTKTGKINGYL